MDLFKSEKHKDKLHQSFKQLQLSSVHKGARKLVNEVYNELPNPDKNFIEQFQTQGFEARLFELGLFSFLGECQLNITQDHERPDFIVSNGVLDVCIEATTSNPTDHLKLQNLSKKEELLLEPKELEDKIRNELAVKMGSPLFSKLKKEYWKLPQCTDKPFIIAIQAAHEPFSALYPVQSLVNYLYGLQSFQEWTEEGDLVAKENKIKFHISGTKKIPSHFFGQDNTEHISGILFSNQLTISKFLRMGFQKGYQSDELEILREGHMIDPIDGKPREFSYKLGHKGAIQETWTQGLTLIINPNANEPIPPGFFPKLTTVIYWDGELRPCLFDFYPMNSVSKIKQL